MIEAKPTTKPTRTVVCAAIHFAGIRVPRGMVVHKDNGSSPVGNGAREDLARMNLAVHLCARG